MSDWLYWTLTIAWWLLGAPIACAAMLAISYWLSNKMNRKDKKK